MVDFKILSFPCVVEDNESRGMDRRHGDNYGDSGYGARYEDQRRQRYDGHYDRGQRPYSRGVV